MEGRRGVTMSTNDKIPKGQLTCLGDEQFFLDKQTD